MKAAVIDIGTNSLHAIFAEVDSVGVIRIFAKDKDMVRLGDGAMVTHTLSSAAIDKTIYSLKRFLHLARHRGITKIHAIATSAVREATNSKEFIRRVQKELGLKIRVISGEEEGRLISLAVKNSIEFHKQKVMVVDIGGGSTEFVLGNAQKDFWSISLRLGANRLSQVFPLSNPPKKAELRLLEAHIAEIMQPVVQNLEKEKVGSIVGCSGTIENLCRLAKGKRGRHFDIGHGESVSARSILKVYERLARLGMEQRKKLPGLDKARADMIIQGAAVFAVFLKLTGIKKIIYSDKALREGVLFDLLLKNRDRLQHETQEVSVRRRGILHLARWCGELKRHGEVCAHLAVNIFDGLSHDFDFEKQDREHLEYAALLHDVGYHISFHKHHRHSAYLIQNAELPGFLPYEVETMAWVARLHRRRPIPKSEGFEKIEPTRQRRILELAGILRIADALDHSHYGSVKSVRMRRSGKNFKMILKSGGDVSWEIHEAEQRKDLFENIFGVKIEFTEAK